MTTTLDVKKLSMAIDEMKDGGREELITDCLTSLVVEAGPDAVLANKLADAASYFSLGQKGAAQEVLREIKRNHTPEGKAAMRAFAKKSEAVDKPKFSLTQQAIGELKEVLPLLKQGGRGEQIKAHIHSIQKTMAMSENALTPDELPLYHFLHALITLIDLRPSAALNAIEDLLKENGEVL